MIPSRKTIDTTKYNAYAAYILSNLAVVFDFYNFGTCKDRFFYTKVNKEPRIIW